MTRGDHKSETHIHPDLAWVESIKLQDEVLCVNNLLQDVRLGDAALQNIQTEAVRLVEGFRADPKLKSLLDAFLQEYGLSPDDDTRDALIADKIAPGDWAAHLGEGSTLLVNASTWGLVVTGKVISKEQSWMQTPATLIRGLTSRMGEPVIRVAVGRAMKILGGEFVLGETIKSAIKRGQKAFGSEQIYSFDMLGEGARTEADALRYLESYSLAIAEAAKMGEVGKVMWRSGVSVKLSALFPRYEFAHRGQVLEIVGQRILRLAKEAQTANIKLTIDAEEADRLGLSLEVFSHSSLWQTRPQGYFLGFLFGERPKLRVHGPFGERGLLGRRNQTRARIGVGGLSGFHPQIYDGLILYGLRSGHAG